MARIGIIFGLLLCGLTIGGLSVTTDKTYTQFVPMMFGIPALFLGVVSLNPHRRAAATWCALSLSLLATSLGTLRLIAFGLEWSSGGFINPLSFRLVVAMTTAAAIFTAIAWFWQRRRRYGDLPIDESPFGDQSSPLFEDSPNLDPSDEPEANRENPYRSPPVLEGSSTEELPIKADDASATNRADEVPRLVGSDSSAKF